MKQNNQPKTMAAGATISEQKTGAEQIAERKALQLENARLRSQQRAGRKSMGAVNATPSQSQITKKAPQLYTPAKINIPADLGEVARLLFRELNKISESQSYILTLWEKVQGQIADAGGVTFTLPVNFAGGVTANGFPLNYDYRFTDVNHVPHPFPLNTTTLGGSDNLNTFTGAHAGVFMNPGNANATPENNYPEALAGTLLVLPNFTYTDGCTQLYYPFAISDHFYARVYVGDDGTNPATWYPWDIFSGAAAVTQMIQTMRTELKAEIYAELRAAGFSI